MKTIKVRTAVILAFCFSLFMGLARAEEYYIYQDPNGKLVISNKEPPPGSGIIKQQTLPEATDSQIQPGQEPSNGQPKEDNDESLKRSKNK